jgi:hypothetical protein
MEDVFIYSFYRSGTNIFSSYLNLHPNIWAGNTGGGKYITQKLYPKGSIFANNVGYKKDEIKYIVYDQVRPKNYVENKKGILLIRDLELINKSAKRINLKPISSTNYNKLINLKEKSNTLTIELTEFINSPKKICDRVTNFLNLSPITDYDPTHCQCGTEFIKIQTTNIVGEKYKHKVPQTYKFCKFHNSVLSAFGGTNPIQPLDINRQIK